MRTILSKQINSGVNGDEWDQSNFREVILSNKISIWLATVTLMGLILAIAYGESVIQVSSLTFLLLLLLVIPINHFGGSLVSKLILAIAPQIFLFHIAYSIGPSIADHLMPLAMTFIGLALIPLLLFRVDQHRVLLTGFLAFNFILILFYDLGLNFLFEQEVNLEIKSQSFLTAKIPFLLLWFFMTGAFMFLKGENDKSESSLKSSNRRLMNLNQAILAQHDEMMTQNDELSRKQAKIEETKGVLESRNNELEKTKVELLKSIDKLQEARDKLLDQEAENRSILSALDGHYFVAQYNLDGSLESLNSKAMEHLQSIELQKLEDAKSLISSQYFGKEKGVRANFFKRLKDQLLKGKSITIDLEIPSRDGSLFLSTTLAPLLNSNNQPFRILAIGHDITEIKLKNEKIDRINAELKEKISEILQQNELLNYQQKEIFDKSEEIKLKSAEISSMNATLEKRVKERTRVLEEKNKQLTEYAFINSHVLRSPISTIMGLVNLISYSKLPEEDQKIYEHLKETALVLDNVVIRINNAIDNGLNFDRNYIEPEREFVPANKV